MSVSTTSTATVTTPAVHSDTPDVDPYDAIAYTVIEHVYDGVMPMFLTANEILMLWGPLDDDRDDYPTGDCDCDDGWCECGYGIDYEDDDTLWDRKYNEVVGTRLAASILNDGVWNPVSLQWDANRVNFHEKPEILGGHHRVILMARNKPNTLIPVDYFHDFHEAAVVKGDDY